MLQPLEHLRNAGLKLTPRRKAIVRLFEENPGPLSPREVRDELQHYFSRCGLPGVYRNLEALAACGVLFRLAGFGRERLYALCLKPGDHYHHHHIVCVICGKVGHIEGCLYQEGMMLAGYRLQSHIVQFEGVCEKCLAQQTQGGKADDR